MPSLGGAAAGGGAGGHLPPNAAFAVRETEGTDVRIAGYVTHRESFALSTSIHLLLEGDLSQVRNQRRSRKAPGDATPTLGEIVALETFAGLTVSELSQDFVAPHKSEVFLFGISETELPSPIKVHHVTFDSSQKQWGFRLKADTQEALNAFTDVMEKSKARTFFLVRDLASARYWETRALARRDVTVEFAKVVFPLPYALVEKEITDDISNGVTRAQGQVFQEDRLPISKCIIVKSMDRLVGKANKKNFKDTGWQKMHVYREAWAPKPNSGKVKGHSDQDFSFAGENFFEHPHKRRLLLSAECQIGKTGTYISLLQQLRLAIRPSAGLPPVIFEPPRFIFEPRVPLTNLPRAVGWVYPCWAFLAVMRRKVVPYFKIRIKIGKYHERIIRFRLLMLLRVLKQECATAEGNNKEGRGKFLRDFVGSYEKTLRHDECIVSAGSKECLRLWSANLNSAENELGGKLLEWFKQEVSCCTESGKWSNATEQRGDLKAPIEKVLRRFLLRALDWDGRFNTFFTKQEARNEDPFADVNGDPTSWEQVFGGVSAMQGRAPANARVHRDDVPDGCVKVKLDAELAQLLAADNARIESGEIFFPCMPSTASLWRRERASRGKQFFLESSRGRLSSSGIQNWTDEDSWTAVLFWIPDDFEHKDWVTFSEEGDMVTGFKEKRLGDQGRFRWIFHPTAFRSEKAMLDYSRSFPPPKLTSLYHSPNMLD